MLFVLAVTVLLCEVSTVYALGVCLASRSNAASTACAHLVSALGSALVSSEGPAYEAAETGAWNIFNTQQRPVCVVFPTSASHVQTAMEAIHSTGANYAVQAGGHSAMQGWNNVEDGVLISFSNMSAIAYDTATDTVTLEPGARFFEAYDFLEPFGVAIVGGRCSEIAPDYILGGGLSFLSPQWGYAADQLKSVDVVLVNGTLVIATAANEYADLFRALKGGGNRFGIATRYELNAIHTGTAAEKTWCGGRITYPSSSLKAVINTSADYTSTTTDPKAVALMSFKIVTETNTATSRVYLFYNGSSLPPSIFSRFLEIPSIQSNIGPLSYHDISFYEPPADPSSPRFGQTYGASALVGSRSLFLDAYSQFVQYTTEVAASGQVNSTSFAITPVLQSQIDKGREMGGNAISPPDGAFAAIQLGAQYNAGVTSISPSVQDAIDRLFERVPPSPGKPLFLNECGKKQEVLASYGDYEWLKQTYAKYDPAGFNVRHTEGPNGLQDERQ